MTQIFSPGEIFHHASKDHDTGFTIPTQLEPVEYEEGKHKCYERFPHIPLEISQTEGSLRELLLKRTSVREFSSKQSSVSSLSTLLLYCSGEQKFLGSSDQNRNNLERRVYPSAGGLYPVETYVLVMQDGDLQKGAYHYCTKQHALEYLWDFFKINHDFDSLFTYPWVKTATYVVVLTGVLHRTTKKYKDRGYRNVLLDVGHIGMLYALTAPITGLSACGLAGTYDENIEMFLDLDRRRESLLYAVVVG